MKANKVLLIFLGGIISLIIYLAFFGRNKISEEERNFPQEVKVKSNLVNGYTELISKIMAHEVLGYDTLYIVIDPMYVEFPVRNGVRMEAYIIKIESIPHAYVIKMSKYIVSTSDLLRVLGHEFAHIKQFEEGRLAPIDQAGGIYAWEGDTLDMGAIHYKQRPHEIHAGDLGRQIEFETTRLLYSK
jgi:hypothetical protein